jgi:hypothetical protein
MGASQSNKNVSRATNPYAYHQQRSRENAQEILGRLSNSFNLNQQELTPEQQSLKNFLTSNQAIAGAGIAANILGNPEQQQRVNQQIAQGFQEYQQDLNRDPRMINRFYRENPQHAYTAFLLDQFGNTRQQNAFRSQTRQDFQNWEQSLQPNESQMQPAGMSIQDQANSFMEDVSRLGGFVSGLITRFDPEGKAQEISQETGMPINEAIDVASEQGAYDETVSPSEEAPETIINESQEEATGVVPTSEIAETITSAGESPAILGSGATTSGLLAPQAKPILKQRAAGILSGISDLFGVNDPNFQDKLVIGLGSMTINPDNPMTRQAMENMRERAELERAVMASLAEAQELSPAEREFEQEMAANIVEFQRSEAFALSDLGVLNNVIQAIESSSEDSPVWRNVVGALARSDSAWAQGIANLLDDETVDRTQVVQQILAKSLKDILGAQFAQREGENFLSRGYNPQLSNAQNAQRLRGLYNVLVNSFNEQKRALEHYNQYRDFRGYQGGLGSDVYIDQIYDFDYGINQTQDLTDSLGYENVTELYNTPPSWWGS